MVINLELIKKTLGAAFNPLASYSVYGPEIRGHGPSGHKVGEIPTNSETLSIYETLPEAPKASTTQEPTRARRQPVRR